MDFTNVSMIMGMVVEENDPTGYGRVKVCIPGKWDISTMSIECLPWVYPLTMWGYQSFSKMEKNSKVWVIENKASEGEFWYIPFFYLEKPAHGDALKPHSDVVISRVGNGGKASLRYNSADGMYMGIGNSYAKINPGGGAILAGGDAKVQVNSGAVYLGTAKGYQPLVKGEQFMKLINGLIDDLKNLQQVASSSPYTQPLSQPIAKLVNNLTSNSKDILSKTVKCN